MNRLRPFYKSFNLLEMGILPEDWERDVHQKVDLYGRPSILEGTASTSRELQGADRIELRIVDGDKIYCHLPWLYNLYAQDLLRLAEQFSGCPLFPAVNLVSSININCIKGKGGRYERHVDSNPVTGVLFVTTMMPDDGGELIFETDGANTIIRPELGVFIAFDARETVHFVKPLALDRERISVPMNFYFSAEEQQRPLDLDSYLY